MLALADKPAAAVGQRLRDESIEFMARQGLCWDEGFSSHLFPLRVEDAIAINSLIRVCAEAISLRLK